MSQHTVQDTAFEERQGNNVSSSMGTYIDSDKDPHRAPARKEQCSPSLEGGTQHRRQGSMDLVIDSELDQERIAPAAPTFSSASSSLTAPSKRAKRNPSVKCPLCHEYVAPGQYQQHYRMELSNLDAGFSQEG